ncbi:MAG: hypothetical protein WCA28_24145 [Bradyrhizobium sp.]
MPKSFLRFPAILTAIVATIFVPALASANDRAPASQIQEEVWALTLALPVLAYLVRPVGTGPFPLVIMNHGVSQDPRERSFFPLVEFRDAAHWFARRGYMVIAPVGPGYGGGGLDLPERGLYGLFFRTLEIATIRTSSERGLRLRPSTIGSSTTCPVKG